jgi:hypothetical protein
LGIAASRIIPWVKLHWRVESAAYLGAAEYDAYLASEYQRYGELLDLLGLSQ